MGNVCSISISIEDTVSRCWDCIIGQASYTCKLEANLKALSVALEELKALKEDVNRRVDLAEQQLMNRRLSQVQVWLSRTEAVITEAEQLVRHVPQEIEKSCLRGCFSMSSYKFGQQVASILEEIGELKSKGVFDKVAENEPPMGLRPTVPTVGLESSLVKVLSLLEQKQVGTIGLYGLGGVGKTTLLTQINNKLISSTSHYDFDVVIWVVVSKDHAVENVQEKIGEKIHLSIESWKNKRSDEKAQDIYGILSRKKFVLLLDDIWERVDLIKLGVPLPSQENGSKVIFTTRLSRVCGKMEAEEKIEVKCSGENEAWALFQQKVGRETIDSHPDVCQLAKKVALECDGLPLALIVIGRAMTGKKSSKSWEFAIEVLKNYAHKFVSTEQELYSILRFSYDYLPSDTIRSCLLYCCLFPEDYLICKSSLINYWFCEGLLDVFESISKARMQGHDIIDTLLNACLLEQDEDEDYIKMHDVIRDMTLWIACECEAVEKRSFVQAGLRLNEAPEVEKWQGVRRMSLMQNRIKCLTSNPQCPNLQTLFLNNNELGRIDNGFFQFMPNLKVLNLSRCEHLRELPKGISNLVSLQCLDLSQTRMTELPIELKSLTKLKYLDLSKMNNVVKIPRQLISSLSNLQECRIYSIYYLEESDEGNILNGGDEDLVVELGSLEHLNALWIEIKGAFALGRFLSFQNLTGCTEHLDLWNFSMSEVFNVSYLAKMERLVKLGLYHCQHVKELKIERESEEERTIQASISPNNTSICFHSLNWVHLDNCGKLRDLTWLIVAPNLSLLWVGLCAEMEDIISEEKLGEVANVVGNLTADPFPKLKGLWLYSLPNLKSIYWKALSFLYLKDIMVNNCPNLKKFPLNSDSAKGNNLMIRGQNWWWEELKWEDEATRKAFLPSFEPVR